MQIEVATDKRFSGGTQIEYFEIKDAIVLQRDGLFEVPVLTMSEPLFIQAPRLTR